jgi:hypothetical protein
MASGVTKTASKSIFSRLKMYIASIMQAMGIRIPKYISLYTKYVFSNTNIAVTKYTIDILSLSVKV